MNTTFSQFVHVFLLSLLLSNGLGCSLIGLGVGALSGSKTTVLYSTQLDSLHAGERVEIMLRDGSIEEGIYGGKNLEPLVTYSLRYAGWHAMLEGNEGIMLLGDTITVVRHSGQTRTNAFGGFDKGIVYLQYNGGGHEPVRMDEIESISIAGTAGAAPMARASLPDHADAPCRTRLVLATSVDAPHVLIEPGKVHHVRILRKSYAWTGFFIGLPIDLLVLGMAIKGFLEWGIGPVLTGGE